MSNRSDAGKSEAGLETTFTPYSRRARYSVAVLAMVVAVLARIVLQNWLGDTFAFITFFPAVVFSSWYGGFGPGVLTAVICVLTAQFFWFEPAFSFWVHNIRDQVSEAAFLVFAVFISVLNDQRLRAMARTREQERKLEEQNARLQQEIKAREKADQREAAQRQWAIQTLSSIGDAVICTDLDARINFMNTVAEKLTGWTWGEAKGRAISDVLVIVNEESRRPIENPVDRVIREGVVLGLANHTRLVTRSGAEVAIDDNGAPIRNQKNEIVGAVLVFRDITERKELEDHLLETSRQLARSNEDLSKFAHMISHDLQEPLRAMVIYAELIKRKYSAELSETPQHWLDEIISSGGRLAQMIRHLLAFCQTPNIDASKFVLVSLADVVSAAERNLADRIKENHAVIYSNQLPSVMGDELQLVELFQNLISNSLKYRSANEPRIDISAETADNHWLIRVHDNGIGVPESQQERIFKWFARGSDATIGSGIGLAICRRIVQRHGGNIWVESKDGPGSTFLFTLARDLEHAV
jgi:PAS domain S-box-containing protein